MDREKSELRRRLERPLVRCLTRVAAWAVRHLSVRGAQRLGDAFGWLIFVTVRSRQRMADRRLQQVLSLIHI